MFFKRISPELEESLQREGFQNPTPFQELFLSKINSGRDIIGISPEKTGKSLALLIAAIQSLGEAYEQAARAMIIVESDEKVKELCGHFEKITRYTDLRIDAITERGKTRDLIDTIYLGTDLIIGTPTRLLKLYLLNGINVTQLQFFAIDDADNMLKGLKNTQALERLLIGMPKCQKLVTSTVLSKRVERLTEEAMPNPVIVELK